MKIVSCQDLVWAKGTIAAGIQRAGSKNYNQAIKFLEKIGELPATIKTIKTTEDFIKDYYETKKPPVIGDVFINVRKEKVEITKIGKSPVGNDFVDYFFAGKKKPIIGSVYSKNKGFLTKKPCS